MLKSQQQLWLIAVFYKGCGTTKLTNSCYYFFFIYISEQFISNTCVFSIIAWIVTDLYRFIYFLYVQLIININGI